MPSWLWRAWLGPAARGPRWLLGRRPRRRRLLPPPPEGLPGPAFIVLFYCAGSSTGAVDLVQCCKIWRFRVPIGCFGLEERWRAANFIAGFRCLSHTRELFTRTRAFH